MNDCCEHNAKCRWGVGSNMPGYMPDGDVEHFANYPDALKAYLGSVAQAISDDGEAYEGGTGQEYDELAATFRLHADLLKRRLVRKRTKHTEAEFRVGQYVHWLARI